MLKFESTVQYKKSISILFFGFYASLVQAMVIDNRYMPLYPHLYNGSTLRKKHVSTDFFALTADHAVSAGEIGHGTEAKKDKDGKLVSGSQVSVYASRLGDGKEIGLFEINGKLNVSELAQSMVDVGYPNPIPVDWRYYSQFDVSMTGKLQGAGFALQSFLPFTDWGAFGASLFFMSVSTYVQLAPTADTTRKLLLDTPGQYQTFLHMMQDIEETLHVATGSYKKGGPSDLDLYFSLYSSNPFTFRFRNIDAQLQGGVLIPTGPIQNISDVGSIPFGGNGHWGLYLATQMEFLLKEDWKIGFLARIQKRLPKTMETRVPLGDEPNGFGVIVGDMNINPGVTFIFSPYAVLEDLNGGFGLSAKFHAAVHDYDQYTDMRAVKVPVINSFKTQYDRSGWFDEHANVSLFYDMSIKKLDWKYAPLFRFSWDFPTNFLGGRGYAKTHRIMLGMTMNF
ncbi:hypothetical protein EBQ93_04960 [bacterium]|nr:hypothetical protein [bacterium]